MEIHEAANIFPMDGSSIGSLAEDIASNGLQVPIELFQGQIIDGRRRAAACEKAGVEPKFRHVSPADPVAYVLSLNLHRRHLTPAQRAMVGARAREIYDRQAKERMTEGGRSGGKGRPKQGVENLPPPNSDTGKARDQVGKVVGVSGKSIDHATRVINHAVPEVIKAVDEGRMAISTAAILSAEHPEAQKREATEPKRNRTYTPCSQRHNGQSDDDDGEPEEGVLRGKGIILANEAINCLTRIPKNDALRKRGFQLVTDWIKRNQ